MSDRPITVGDLVVTVRSCCDRYMDGVYTFQVDSIVYREFTTVCEGCRQRLPKGNFARDTTSYYGAPVSWLKRIPPLDELEGTKTDEPIKEPA